MEYKYLKYKKKYLQLKNQLGGNNIELLQKLFPSFKDSEIESINYILLENPNCLNKINKYREFIIKYGYNKNIIKLICNGDIDIIFDTLPENYLTKQNYIIDVRNQIFTYEDSLLDNPPSIDKLYNKKTFKFKKDLINKWLCSQCSSNAKKLGKFILDITRHVSYEEFDLKLLESINKIPINKKYIIFILQKEDDEPKSNLWISAILIDKIQSLGIPIDIVDILYSYDNYKKQKLIFYNENNIDIIICDDGSFSGLQLEAEILNELLYIYDKNKIFCLIPFMSNFAINRVNNNPNVELLNVDKIETVKERCLKLNINIPELDDIDIPEKKIKLDINNDSDIITLGRYFNHYFTNFRDNYEYNLLRRSMPFYFDHKVADYISTFPVIYQLGFIKKEGNCPTNLDHSLLFDNCDGIPTYDSLNTKDFSLYSCIIPYYKLIDIKIIHSPL